MRTYADDSSYPHLQMMHGVLAAAGLNPPEFTAILYAGNASDPHYVELYYDLKRVAVYGRGFGIPKLIELHYVPEEVPNDASLLVSKTGNVLTAGTKVRDFRGELMEVDSWEAPVHEGSSGRVIVRFCNDEQNPDSMGRFYPGVIDCFIVKAGRLEP